MGRVFSILSIDGGGLRGLIPVVFLLELERRTGQPIHRLFDLIAGTSTGGILGMGIAVPDADGQPRYTVRDGLRLYREEGPKIFSRDLRRGLTTLNGLTGPRYRADAMTAALADYLGSARLQHTLTDLVITAYDIERRSPWFFRSLRARARPDYDFPLVDVGRAATAAPANFAPARLTLADGETYTLVDGGVFANNPAMIAYVDALSLYADRGYDSVLVVSLGTGFVQRGFPYSAARGWGLLGWGLPAIDILKTGANESVDYQMRQVLNRMTQQADDDQAAHRYYRLQVELQPGQDSMDDSTPAHLDRLEAAARRYVDANSALFDRISQQLIEGMTPSA
jgi:patatin-like phospholipase/acyl hydrolase